MGKPILGLILGGILGALDGWSALLSAPEVAPDIVGIVIGSTMKGLLGGVITGYYARRVRSLRAGLIFGGAVGLFLAFLVAVFPQPDGSHYWWEIMLPGTIVGLIVGYATQVYGKVRLACGEPQPVAEFGVAPSGCARRVVDEYGRHRQKSSCPVTALRGSVLVVLVSCAFFASWWNRYVPPTSGGELVLMARWAHDYLPYRDYFFQAPPGVPMLLQAIQGIAGPYLLAALTFGALLRIASACALYGLLLRISRPSFAAIATITALFVSSTDVSDTTFYYNHLGAALILIGAYVGAVGATGRQWTHRLAGVCGGGLIAYAVAIKQTMILGAAAAVVALIVLALPRPRSGWTGWLLGLSAGGAISVAAVWAWLARNGLLDAWQHAMARAPAGKGGIGRSLMRPLTLVDAIQDVFLASIGAWIVIGIVAAIWRRHEQGKSCLRRDSCGVGGARCRVHQDVRRIVTWTCADVVSHGAGVVGEPRAGTPALALPTQGSARPCRSNHHRSWDALVRHRLFLHGVLAPLRERRVSRPCPCGRGDARAAAINGAQAVGRRDPDTRSPLDGACRSTGSSPIPTCGAPGSNRHSTAPTAPSNTHPSRACGSLSPPPTFTPGSPGWRENTPHTDDRIYVFPNLPILYAIADRRPATFALAHWVDICPDYVGKEDAVRLRTSPPKIMILRDDPAGLVGMEEWLYRGGEASSVRDVLAALEDLKPSYDKVSVFRNSASWPISIFVRREHPDGKPRTTAPSQATGPERAPPPRPAIVPSRSARSSSRSRPARRRRDARRRRRASRRCRRRDRRVPAASPGFSRRAFHFPIRTACWNPRS